MGTSESGVDYSYVLNPERLKRRLAIRIVVALSAAGFIVVLASWLSN